ncbi:Ferric uptake regulation protein FUR [Mariniradius saccharolyticus AK6]|jgi:Fur family transcriptional regulator, ferric uptake regulator|uniref:Ferric uptake regulation protein n=2 Tax=Mariniradius TaxID=1245590 RepID=M7XDG6_9BACT|nr:MULTISPECIES: transcriptional repressor [Mariniradius]EMS32904.1 Ferric uptake regulation protein FUR [Mariniradius saccharolyticus AK6]MCF1753253.1 transcriptional repressor [Mariniradius sediminis]
MAEQSVLEKAKKIFENFLLRQGSRKTPERFSVIDELYALPQDEHIDVEGLFLLMRNKGYTISRATIYNTLDLLVECGLAVKHQFKDKVALYEQALTYQHHDHHVCNQCRKIREFSDERINAIKETMGRELQSAITSHSLVLYGDCQIENCENLAIV